jgi:small subunit ribosomal protein S8
MTTDTVADMVTRIRNAYLANRKFAILPSSKMAIQFSEILLKEGLIWTYQKPNYDAQQHIFLGLMYDGRGYKRKPKIEKIQQVSSPGRRVYSGAKRVPRILEGFGIAIVSTSRGLITDREARKARIGGEILCYIW